MDITVPKLAVSMIEGTLVRWEVADGATVNANEPLYSIETDKVEQEIESPATGVVRHLGTEGEVYDVGAVIGRIEEA